MGIVAGGRRERIPVQHAGPRGSPEDDDLTHPGQPVSDGRERRGVLRIDVDDDRVRVVDDIGRLLGGEAVVERDRDKAELGAGVYGPHHSG